MLNSGNLSRTSHSTRVNFYNCFPIAPIEVRDRSLMASDSSFEQHILERKTWQSLFELPKENSDVSIANWTEMNLSEGGTLVAFDWRPAGKHTPHKLIWLVTEAVHIRGNNGSSWKWSWLPSRSRTTTVIYSHNVSGRNCSWREFFWLSTEVPETSQWARLVIKSNFFWSTISISA